MDEDKTESDLEHKVIGKEEWDNHEPEQLAAIRLAGAFMEEFHPAFVVVADPELRMTPRGFLFPKNIGISLNDEIGITRSVAAAILREIAEGLDEDINKVMQFVREATGDDFN